MVLLGLQNEIIRGWNSLIRSLLILHCFLFHASVYGTLAGGRLNAFSGGENAFAGVVNPANAVWLKDRFDIGTFWVRQKSSLFNHNNSPALPPGKLDLTYRSKIIHTFDAAILKHFTFKGIDTSFSLSAYTLPNYLKLRTKVPLPLSGTTPIENLDRTDAISAVFSFKLTPSHSIGFSVDYFYFSHLRNGYQHADNPLRSVSPGNVTNNGEDHSSGIGFSLGWRWKITDKLDFGTAWTKKSYCGRYLKYQGYEPYRAKNYNPQALGAGFSYHFTPKMAGRLESLWVKQSNLPKANNNILPNGHLNTNKRGSSKSPGPGLQDAIYLNMGLGYQLSSSLAIGSGYSHRFRLPRNSPFILAHSYALQTIFDTLTFGANFNYQKHNIFLGILYGFRNKISGLMPEELGGGRFTSVKQNVSLSLSWGYQY